MRTFKRPMFRKGGNVGVGIMTGIVDRSMRAEDPIVIGNEPFVSNVDMGQPKTQAEYIEEIRACLLYTSPSPRDGLLSRMPSSA